jgi:LuxR family maltose regulon positive regulatory protein
LTAQSNDAEQRLKLGIALARRLGRPFLEFTGLAQLATVEAFQSQAQGTENARRAIELAGRHGWTGEHAAGVASGVLGGALAWRGMLADAEPWIQRAERAVRAEAQPIAGLCVCLNRALLELGRGRNPEALAALRAVDRLAGLLAAPNPVLTVIRAFQAQTLALLGETEHAGRVLAGLGEQERGCGEARIATAVLRLAQDDPHGAAAALAPVLDGSAPLLRPAWLTQAFLLEAIARDALGAPGPADRALERALDLAEPDGALLPFLLHPALGIIQRHTGHSTVHAALTTEIEGLLAGPRSAPPSADPQPASGRLSPSELRVLRYLPTNLTAPEIADELHITRNTVKTHMRNLYSKLGTHRRSEALARARDLGLLAPSAHRRSG